MPKSWIVRGLKQVKHRQQRELTSENERETAAKSQKNARAKRAKLPLFIVIYAMQISDVLAAVVVEVI